MTVINKAKAEQTKKEKRAEVHKLSNSRKNRGQTPDERRETYRHYREIKKKVLELEKRNNSHLYLFPSSDSETNAKKFYNMGGNSAVIYCCDLGPKLKRKPVLRADADNGDIRFAFGVCSIVDIEKLEEKLRPLGIKRLADEGEVIVFKLSKTYTNDDIRAMANSEQTKLDSLNALIFSQVLYPEIHKLILELKRIIPPKVKNVNREYREMFGDDMIKPMRDLSLTYLRMTEGDILAEDGAKEMLLSLSAMLDAISLYNELRLWDIVTCIRISQIIVQLRQTIKGKILSKC